MTKTYAATALNFFFPGAGYLVLGQKTPLAIMWLIGAFGLTAVEQSHLWMDVGLQDTFPQLFQIMFVAVFLMNTAFAIDAYQTGKALAEND